VLTEHEHLLPDTGRALDIACGLGANTRFLADHGLMVDAWDLSDVAIDALQQSIQSNHLYSNNAYSNKVHCKALDITLEDLTPDTWHVIVSCHYLDRNLIPAMKEALKPGGRLFFQTFTADKVVNIGPGNPDFLLAPDELPVLMSGLTVLSYVNEGSNPDTRHPLAGLACIVAQKR
jgi:SAM-dependent methyltransferase